MKKYTIIVGPVQSDVPIPKFNESYPCSTIANALLEMKTGDSREFSYPQGQYPSKFQASLLRVAQTINLPITTRKKADGSGIRVWRVHKKTSHAGRHKRITSQNYENYYQPIRLRPQDEQGRPSASP